MTDSMWTKRGATLSHNNACKEFGLDKNIVIEAIRNGELQYRQGVAHGNPYYKLLRVEVEKFALEFRGANGKKEQEHLHKLKLVNREINSLKRKLTSLEKQKIKLIDEQEKLTSNEI